MKSMVGFIVLGAAAGLVVGYFLFAKIGGSYINPLTILLPAQGLMDKVAGAVLNVAAVRTNIFIAGGVGAAAGLVLALVLGKRR